MLQIGQQFRDYIIEREIGQGGMGVVYLVRHVDLDFFDLQGHRVLKVIQSQHLQDHRFQEQFKKEALNGIKLSEYNHPNLVKVIDYFPEQSMSAILMEYVEGLSLGDIKQIRLKQILSVIGPVCKALDFIHSKGTIHRDIKPENIRLARQRGPVILDLGIAKNLEASNHTTTNAYGSEPFVAPERHDPNIGKVSGAIDQYSVAMIVFYWLTGRFPWPENYQSSQVLLMKCRDKLPPLSEIRPDLPIETCSVVDKALSMKPEDRFKSCMAFAIALKDSMQGLDLNQSVQLSGLQEATEFFDSTSANEAPSVDPTRPILSPTRPVPSASSPSSVPSPTKPMAKMEDSSSLEAVPKTVPLASASTTNHAKVVPIEKEESDNSKSSNRKGLVVGLCVLLIVFLGFQWQNHQQEQAAYQAQMDDLLQGVSTEVPVPTGTLSQEIVDAFIASVEEQKGFQERLSKWSEDATEFHVEVPAGMLSEEVCTQFERELEEQRSLRTQWSKWSNKAENFGISLPASRWTVSQVESTIAEVQNAEKADLVDYAKVNWSALTETRDALDEMRQNSIEFDYVLLQPIEDFIDVLVSRKLEIDRSHTQDGIHVGNGKVIEFNIPEIFYAIDWLGSYGCAFSFDDGTYKFFRNNPINSEGIVIYECSRDLKLDQFFVVRAGYWEGSSHYLINKSNGDVTRLEEEPTVAPNGPYLEVSASIICGYGGQGFSIYWYNEDTNKVIEEHSDWTRCSPERQDSFRTKWTIDNALLVERLDQEGNVVYEKYKRVSDSKETYWKVETGSAF